MLQLVPQLLLRADPGDSHSASLLRAAGYRVNKINQDSAAEHLAGSPAIDAVIVELPALAAIAMARRIRASRHDAAIIVITCEVEAVRWALPTAYVMGPDCLEDDLVSTVDLALVAQQMQLTG